MRFDVGAEGTTGSLGVSCCSGSGTVAFAGFALCLVLGELVRYRWVGKAWVFAPLAYHAWLVFLGGLAIVCSAL